MTEMSAAGGMSLAGPSGSDVRAALDQPV